MRLEQIAYESRQLQEKIQVYRVGDLERLSASALYTPKISIPKIGMGLPGGLNIKDLTKNSIVLQGDFGGIGNIYTFHPNGIGSLRFYGLGKGKEKVTKKTFKF